MNGYRQMLGLFKGSQGKERLGSSLATLGTINLHLSLEQREVCVHGRSIGCKLRHLFSFSSLWPDNAYLSWLPTICKYLIACWPHGQSGGEGGGKQGVIYHCQEMCCTQQGRLSSLLLLQLELQIVKRCRTCTSQITIHHLGSGSPESSPSPREADPLGLQPLVPLEFGTRGLFGCLFPVPANAHPGQATGLKFSAMISKPLPSLQSQISRSLSAIRLLPRWPIIIKL